MTGGFRFLEHTSEVGIRATGDSCEEIFGQVAEGVAELLGAWFPGHGTERPVTVTAGDREALLAAWVDELLYLHESEDAVFGAFRVERVDQGRLEGSVSMAPRADRVLEGVGVKAATYHRLGVAREGDRWVAQVYVDV